jgi:hypothetical protein
MGHRKFWGSCDFLHKKLIILLLSLYGLCKFAYFPPCRKFLLRWFPKLQKFS